MSMQRIIAYGMHEQELQEATVSLDNPTATESYVVGDIEESQIPALEERGLIVETLSEPEGLAAADTPAAARRGVKGAGAVPSASPAADEIPPAESGVPTQWLMELREPLLESAREQIEGTGARLEEHVPSSAYVVTATPEQAEDLINVDVVVDVVRYGPAVTGPIFLSAGRRGAPEASPEREVEWDAWLVDENARERLESWCADHGIHVVGSGGRKVRFKLSADAPEQLEIQTLPGVLTVVEFVPPHWHNDVARAELGLNGGNSAHGIGLRGRGQVVGVADTGLDASHPDFQGRVSGLVARGRPGDPSDPDGHGTHVAGSVLADGSASGGQFCGTAPEAELFFQSIMDAKGELGGLPVALADLFQEAYDAGVRVHNNSWGADTESAYTIDSTEVDDFVASHRDMLLVISAGNDGTAADPRNAKPGFVDWLSIGSPASCKNALTVGAQRNRRSEGGLSKTQYKRIWPDEFPKPPIGDQLISGDPECLAAFSSRGPCDDMRIKPDVVAPGTDVVSTRSAKAKPENFWALHPNQAYAYLGGTSMAAPLVTGCAALVRQHYLDERGHEPSAALLKATLVNGTRWLAGADAVADFADQPNYHQGFGAVDMTGSIPSASNPALRLELVDTWQDGDMQFKRTGQRFRFAVTADTGLPFRATLAYTDVAARALQNDLSIVVQDPDGGKHIGNERVPQGMHIPDPHNNVEVIRIDDPPPGEYIIQIFARNLLRGPQDFALAVSGELADSIRRVPG